MNRAVLYARYSSDLQSAASIEDQLRVCTEYAGREGWEIVGTYRDAAISGASIALRPGLKSLLQDAESGKFDIVLSEALDRLSRDQADMATLFKRLSFRRVKIVTRSEGAISELHIGFQGTMNALMLKELAAKTQRGQGGKVLKGVFPGGRAYGYRVDHQIGADGKVIRGGRAIIEHEADIVRRIFRQFSAGVSPIEIARRLNAEGVVPPKSRHKTKLWRDTTIRGHAKRETGILNNQLYRGILVWNRQHYLKNPDTGKRVSRINSPDEWLTSEMSELRIIDEELWHAAKLRQEQVSIEFEPAAKGRRAAASNALNATHRAQFLFSGLLVCGVCGGRFTKRGQDRYACADRAVHTNGCSNSWTISRQALEARVLSGMRERLLAPEVVAEAMRSYAQETNRLNRARASAGDAHRSELEKISRSIREILALVEDGAGSRTLITRLRELESREEELQTSLAMAPAVVPEIHPNVAELYKRKVERLSDALADPSERDDAFHVIRGLIDQIVVSPGASRGQVELALKGELGTILDWATQKQNTHHAAAAGMSVSVVAGTGFGLCRLRRNPQPELTDPRLELLGRHPTG
jgi:site-specific DNA recombinase